MTSDVVPDRVVDTRDHPGESCVSLTTAALDALDVGGRLLLIADHDPRGLRYLFEAERPGALAWESLQEGPERWQAILCKLAASE